MPDSIEEVFVSTFAEENADVSVYEGFCESAVIEGFEEVVADEGVVC